MKLYELPISVILDDFNKDALKFIDVINYLYGRIDNKKYCTVEEIQKLDELSNQIRKLDLSKKQKNKLLEYARNLFLLSCDNLYKTSDYEIVNKIEYSKKNFNHGGQDITYEPKNENDFELKEKYDYFNIIITKVGNYLSYSKLVPALGNLFKDLSIEHKENLLEMLKQCSFDNFNEEEKIETKSIIRNLARKLENEKNQSRANEDNYNFKGKIINGDIVFSREFSSGIIKTIKLDFSDLEIVDGERIISIDDSTSPDLDGAFSIEKMDDITILNVYISDVPSFLKENRKLSEEAYLRGNSFYIRNFSKDRKYLNNTNIDMIPSYISHKFLSLNKGYPKNTICFKFIIGQNGEIYSRDVSRKRIIVTDKLTPEDASHLLTTNDNYGPLQEDLRNYQSLVKNISNNSNDLYLKRLWFNRVSDIVGLPSVLVNYYIGHEADFAIYRENGQYVKKYENNPYTHSSTPLRRFVSDINLAFFLNQNGVVNFNEADLNYVENNIDSIIAHLNEQDKLVNFVDKNPNFVKKYLKK